MRRVIRTTALALAAVIPLGLAHADAEVDADVASAVGTALQRINPDLEADTIRPTPLEGLFEVVVNGRLIYMSGDGRYLVQGEILDLDSERSISEGFYQEQRRDTIDTVSTDDMVVYPADGETRHTVTIFTDVECPFCQRLHAEMDQINALGIEVRYILMPRQVPSSAYRKSVAVYCADDRRAKMDEAKGGMLDDYRGEECTNPIQEHVQLAQSLGVRATPTLVTDAGRMHEGYLSPEDLETFLEEGKLEYDRGPEEDLRVDPAG